jgi:hypothetical protein
MQLIRLTADGTDDTPQPVSAAVVIGRDDLCDIVVPSDQASRQHARLTPTDTGALIEDLDSENGIRVNGLRIRQSQALEVGDFICIGDVEYRLASGSAPGPAAAAAAGAMPAEGGAMPAAAGVLRGAAAGWRALKPGDRALLSAVAAVVAAGMIWVLWPRGGAPASPPRAAQPPTAQPPTAQPASAPTSAPRVIKAPVPAADDTWVVNAAPPHAELLVDGKQRIALTPHPDNPYHAAPVPLPALSPGAHSLQLTYKGTRTPPRTIHVPPQGESTARLVLWLPDTRVQTRDGASYFGMITGRSLNGDLTLALSATESIQISAADIIRSRASQPVAIRDMSGVSISADAESGAPELTVDAFPGRPEAAPRSKKRNRRRQR